MKKKKSYVLLIVCFVIIGLIFLYRQRTVNNEGIPKIGVILPLTGEAASYGKSLKQGLDLAVHNSKVELIYEDSKGEPKTAVNAVNKLVSSDKIDVLIGDMFTNTTMAIVPIANRYGILLLTPTASSSEISERGKTTFRLYPSEKEEGNLLYSFAQENFRDRKGTILVVNEDAMQNVAKIVNTDGTKQVITYAKGMSDFAPLVEKIDKDVDVIYLIGYFEESTMFIKQSVEMNKKYSFVGLSTLYTPQLAIRLGNINNPIYISAPKSSLNNDEPLTGEFVRQFIAKYHTEPDIWAGYGYDSGKIVIKIMNESSASGKSYADEMYNIVNYNGVTGSITVNKDRSINKSMDMVEYHDGKFSDIKY